MSNYRKQLDKIVDNVGYTIVRIAPIVAPIPALATLLEATGYAMYAWFVVVAVELTGYAIGEEAVKAIRLRIFSIRNIAWALGIYAFIIEGLMIGYKVLPAWVEWQSGQGELSHAIQASVGILYPAFTIAGAFLFALHEYLEEVQGDKEYDKETSRERDQAAWEDDREWKRTEREAKLAAKLAGKSQKTLSETVAPVVDTFQETVTESVGKRIVRYLIENPGAKLDDIADHVGQTPSAVSKQIKPLVETGVLHAVKEGRRNILTVNGEHEKYLAS